MNADYAAILDACVLLPMPLADTLLRMAETPRLYLPKWSDQIMEEVNRNLGGKPWNKTIEQVQHREKALRTHFPEAWVDGYESLIDLMTNHPKDRHVLAAAVSCGTKLIITYNAKDFQKSALAPWGIECQGPSTFLIHLYGLEAGIVVQKLSEQAQNLNISLNDLLKRLQSNVPNFVSFFCEQQRIELNPSSAVEQA